MSPEREKEIEAVADYLERLAPETDWKNTMLAGAWAIKDLRAERDALLKALKQLCIACPSSLECGDFDHRHPDRHSFTEECRPAHAYMSALEQAKAAMSSSSKEGK